jgi:hypothetical protein
MSTSVTVLVATLDEAGIDGSVDDLVDAAAGSRSMLIDAQAPLVARLHDQPADFAATEALQRLHDALARVDRGPPVVPLQSNETWWRRALA